jgi:hypothetical protein
MTIDWRIITVGYSEPTLWVSVLIATVLAVVGGVHTGIRVVRQVPAGIRRWATGLWLGFLLAGASLVIGVALFSLMFLAATGTSVCTFVVGRVLLVPAAAGLVSEALASWVTAKRVNRAV